MTGATKDAASTVPCRRDPDRSRDLFGVQLEVTGLLLEAERRKLAVLQRDLQTALAEGGSIKAKEHQKQELLSAISKIQAQHDHLDKEYRHHAMGALRNSKTRGSGKKANNLEAMFACTARLIRNNACLRAGWVRACAWGWGVGWTGGGVWLASTQTTSGFRSGVAASPVAQHGTPVRQSPLRHLFTASTAFNLNRDRIGVHWVSAVGFCCVLVSQCE
ncbi:hypothetical protein LSTR_LSTR007470 [Laodelphax striatellus]|uniref:Uncharacterized protein n=1 Tax=Laodelphax striatellus TaxID=195883 RepID=A0A482X470_LAOST|nr:hypothetical protein LSTR_LSTR007470 [Laodelphax striatellus]